MEDRALRADAARNRERILAAAEQVFAERGLEASVAEVAKRAGVGKATVFRSYPTKEDLIEAITSERVRRVEQLAKVALDEPDAWVAFKNLLMDVAQQQATDQTQVAALARASNAPQLADARAATYAALRKLMEKAKEQGAMRADATPDDLRVLFHGVTHELADDERRDVATWTRWAVLFAAALRADPEGGHA
jgi:AcrR family transcriptional regulator